MIDGHIVVDAHAHAPVLSALKPVWLHWADTYSEKHEWRQAYRGDQPDPAALADLLTREVVDHALLFCEYSPAATCIQAIDDVVPVATHDPHKFSLVANITMQLPSLLPSASQLGGLLALRDADTAADNAREYIAESHERALKAIMRRPLVMSSEIVPLRSASP